MRNTKTSARSMSAAVEHSAETPVERYGGMASFDKGFMEQRVASHDERGKGGDSKGWGGRVTSNDSRMDWSGRRGRR